MSHKEQSRGAEAAPPASRGGPAQPASVHHYNQWRSDFRYVGPWFALGSMNGPRTPAAARGYVPPYAHRATSSPLTALLARRPASCRLDIRWRALFLDGYIFPFLLKARAASARDSMLQSVRAGCTLALSLSCVAPRSVAADRSFLTCDGHGMRITAVAARSRPLGLAPSWTPVPRSSPTPSAPGSTSWAATSGQA